MGFPNFKDVLNKKRSSELPQASSNEVSARGVPGQNVVSQPLIDYNETRSLRYAYNVRQAERPQVNFAQTNASPSNVAGQAALQRAAAEAERERQSNERRRQLALAKAPRLQGPSSPAPAQAIVPRVSNSSIAEHEAREREVRFFDIVWPLWGLDGAEQSKLNQHILRYIQTNFQIEDFCEGGNLCGDFSILGAMERLVPDVRDNRMRQGVNERQQMLKYLETQRKNGFWTPRHNRSAHPFGVDGDEQNSSRGMGGVGTMIDTAGWLAYADIYSIIIVVRAPQEQVHVFFPREETKPTSVVFVHNTGLHNQTYTPRTVHRDIFQT